MSESIDNSVREFVARELPLVTTLLLKKVAIDDSSALQDMYEAEDVAELMDRYFTHFNVQRGDFSLNSYYPWKVKSLLSRRPVNPGKIPLTINMFIASAKAGRWLYS
jgi:hypothetical protein